MVAEIHTVIWLIYWYIVYTEHFKCVFLSVYMGVIPVTFVKSHGPDVAQVS